MQARRQYPHSERTEQSNCLLRSAEQTSTRKTATSPSASFSLTFNLPDSRPPSPASSIFSTTSANTMSSTNSRPDAAAIAERDYFSENSPPAFLNKHAAEAKAFINEHVASRRRVVLVTSGGTTVPLERQTVRFIDNFSAGTRGATSAEYFLEAGYAVIFLHRQFSLLPYSRHYSHATDCFLDFLREGAGGEVGVNEQYREKMLAVLQKYNQAKQRNLLLTLPFTTINDYLFVLREVSKLMAPLGSSSLLYLAAAVSDFFVPPERMVEHKIQSTTAADSTSTPTTGHSRSDAETETSTLSEGVHNSITDTPFDNFDSIPSPIPRSKRLIIDLDPVPKFLKNLVDGWAPEGMIVSFKLETDPQLLVHKAQHSLERYAHHLVIGNLLATRKWEVVFVSRDETAKTASTTTTHGKTEGEPKMKEKWIRVPAHRRKKTISGIEHLVGAAGGREGPSDPADLPSGEPEMEIESLIIPAVEEMHSQFIASAETRKR